MTEFPYQLHFSLNCTDPMIVDFSPLFSKSARNLIISFHTRVARRGDKALESFKHECALPIFSIFAQVIAGENVTDKSERGSIGTLDFVYSDEHGAVKICFLNSPTISVSIMAVNAPSSEAVNKVSRSACIE